VITAMLNWYDEEPDELRRVVGDLARLGVDRVVAVDGPYANFPGADDMPISWVQAHEALRDQVLARGMLYIGVSNPVPWTGDEVAKRKFMLDLALGVTPAGEWLMIYDADYELVECGVDIPGLLARLDEDALDITFTTAPPIPDGDHPMRMFLRAAPGLHMGNNHYTYFYADGRKSTVMADGSALAGHWTRAVRVYHAHHDRPAERHDRQAAYYHVRDTQKLETP
jgi:hypothetical protein